MSTQPFCKLKKKRDYADLETAFPRLIRYDVPLAKYTSARVGGPSDVFIEINQISDLVRIMELIWAQHYDYLILGGGSNVLVSDLGFRGIVILNRCRKTKIQDIEGIPALWAESGTNFGRIARTISVQGYQGLEWAAGIPGTVGGAVAGNTGAHGCDVSSSLLVAKILHRSLGVVDWKTEAFKFDYRSSILKQEPGLAIVLEAYFRLQACNAAEIQQKMESFIEFRKRTQPPGASMGSMFKNPPGDYAGRLIEAAGLKGTRVGGAEISPLHGNFFINHGNATAEEIRKLISLTQKEIYAKFNVRLEMEIELIGEWNQYEQP